MLLHANLSGLAILKHLHQEAIGHAVKAVSLAPHENRAHWALINAVLTLPQGEELREEHRDRFHESLKFLAARFPTSGLQTIPVEGGPEIIAKMLKEQHDRTKQVWDLVRERKLPMAFLSAMVGRSPFAIWRGLQSGGEVCIHFATGTTEEQQNEMAAASSGKPVSLDIFSLFTLRLLGHLELLPKLFERVYVYSGVLEAISQEIYDLENRKTKGFGVLAHTGQSMQMAEVSPQEVQVELEFLRPIQAFLKSPNVELCGIDAASLEKQDKEKVIQALGNVLHHPILVAADKKASFYCDDVGLRSLARSRYNVEGLCTQGILRAAVTKKLITPRQYEDAVLTLLKSNYRFVSESPDTLIRLMEADNYTMSIVAQQLIRRITEPEINKQRSAQILGVVFAHLWRYAPATAGTPRTVWLTEPTFPILPMAGDHRGPFSFIDQHFIPSDTAIKPFCDSKIGFPTPAEMPSALDCVPHRFSTER